MHNVKRINAYGQVNTLQTATVPGIGPGGWDSGALARNQERAQRLPALPTTFRVYTEYREGLARIVAAHFEAATIYLTEGIYRGQIEHGAVIEIIGDYADRKRVIALSSAIALANDQIEVLATWQNARGADRVNVYGRN